MISASSSVMKPLKGLLLKCAGAMTILSFPEVSDSKSGLIFVVFLFWVDFFHCRLSHVDSCNLGPRFARACLSCENVKIYCLFLLCKNVSFRLHLPIVIVLLTILCLSNCSVKVANICRYRSLFCSITIFMSILCPTVFDHQ